MVECPHHSDLHGPTLRKKPPEIGPAVETRDRHREGSRSDGWESDCRASAGGGTGIVIFFLAKKRPKGSYEFFFDDLHWELKTMQFSPQTFGFHEKYC